MQKEAATTAAPSAPPTTGAIVDRFGRSFDYLRVAVNERCNLRCVYCMPEEGLAFKEGDALLTREEILRVVRALAAAGVSKVRFTGGEPLLRRDLVEIIRGAAAVPGIDSLHLTTNGLLLEKNAATLLAAGLTGVNVSLDTLQAARFLKITRRAGVERVLAAIRAAVRTGFPSVKVNVVALRGFNDDELAAFVDLTRETAVTVRFIELMPFDSHQVWKRGHFFSAAWIVEALRHAVPGLESATGTRTEEHVFQAPGHRGKVAVIPAYTRSLCATCNRMRLTADGRIRNCLFSTEEFDVKTLLRGGATDADLLAAFRAAMWAKLTDGWAAQRAASPPANPGDRASMTLIGG